MQKTISIKSNDPTQIYYNIDIINNDVSDEGKQLILDFDETRTGTFLNNPEDYFISVVRFSLDSISLPVFIPQIDQNAGINDTIYYITVHNTVASFTKRIIYTPENLSIPAPVSSNPQDNSKLYYNVQSFEIWVQMINKAISDACSDALISDVPFFRFDGSTNLIDLYYPESWVSSGFKLLINNPLETLLSVFPFRKYPKSGYDNNPLAIHEFLIYESYKKETIGTTTYYVKTSENTPISLWNPISSIVFVSTRLPILSSFTGAPKIFNSKQTLSSNGYNDNLTSILTDFSVAIGGLNTYKPNLYYEPSGEYRLVDLIGNIPLNSVHLKVYYKDKFDNLIPFLLNSGCMASLKLMFRKKSFNGSL